MRMRLLWLALGLIPYAALAGYDGWLHERARVVPRIEQILHAALAVLLLTFLFYVVRAQLSSALVALCAFLVVLVADELGYHAKLTAHERRVHWLADAALFGFLLFWLWLDGVI